MNTTLPLPILALSLALLGGCNAPKAPTPAEPPTATALPPTPPAATQPAEHCGPHPEGDCVAGVKGGQCSDALVRASCVEGAWSCPEGLIWTTECGCLGKPMPGCTCDGGGWKCSDAGLPK